MSEILTDVWRTVALFVPKALAFVAIVVVGWLIARVLRSATDKVLERVGFDRLVERGGIRAALARSKYDASDIVAKLVFYAVLLFTLQLAFGIWGDNPVSDLITSVVAWLPRAFVAVVIVVVAAAIANGVKDLVGNALGGLSYGRLLANVASVFILGLGIIAALNQIGVATTVTTPILVAVLATVAGILIVGVGGGLVRPMQHRWEGWLEKASTESQKVAEHARAYGAGRQTTETAMTAPPAAGTGGYAPVQDERVATGARPADLPSYSTGAAPAYPATAGEEPTQVLPSHGTDPYRQ
ncbi:MAG TPA: hypothetical protein VES42_00880 [Pilimelia sp.]|nr:hypothetical protein [Pilimelia sp.]